MLDAANDALRREGDQIVLAAMDREKDEIERGHVVVTRELMRLLTLVLVGTAVLTHEMQ